MWWCLFVCLKKTNKQTNKKETKKKTISWETDLWVMLGDFEINMENWEGKSVCLYSHYSGYNGTPLIYVI